MMGFAALNPSYEAATRLLNFQDRKGKIPVYQARQLIIMMDRYEKEQDT
jgi:hypothetical protein